MQHTNKIILGTVQFGLPYGINNTQGMPGRNQVFKILELAHANGIRILDTAEAYGTAESLIGEYHAGHDHAFDIISKFKYKEGTQLREYLQLKTAALKISELYSYMFHSAGDYLSHPELKKLLLSFKKEGLIRKTGVSIYTNDEFRQVLADDDIDLVQLPFNLLDNNFQRGALLKEAKERGKEIHVRSVFLQGLFFKDPQELPEKLKPLSKYILKLRDLSVTAGIPVQQLALQYALSNEYIDKVLIGVDSLEQFQANLSVVQNNNGLRVGSQIDEIEVSETLLLNPANW
ncbi:Predicted oxidoreductase [Chitinophaga niabensis]|uniref:Predicted oxidoreductase n=2 Tax=Chitinophaga niabensis TaxID=536979 RepID=A0A1N6JXR5_9BACT|nr:Predicted oxidoreductase [Chitinophaga niabensis]